MSQDLNLRLRITGDGSGLKGEIRTASGEVVKFSDTLEGGAKRGTRALRDTEKQTGRLSNTTRQLTRRVAAVAAGYLSFQGVSRTLRTITENTLEQERVWRQLEAGIAATGGAAGRSLGQLQAMSAELQSTTTFANEQVEQVQAQMLAFRNISENVFDRTLRLVLDFAQTTGRDATQGVRTLALAINDPLQGMGRLSQAGISLNKELQETVRELVETGELTKAQNLLLDELTASFGGAAAAARDTFGGALQAIRNDFDDLLKFTGDMPELAAEIEAISERLRDPELVGTVEEGIAAALGLIPPAVNAGVSALELIIPLMTTTAENADKIGTAARVVSTILAGRLVASLAAATTAKATALVSAQRYGAALVGLAGMSNTAAAGQLALAAGARTASGALALVGGPVGALVLGVGALAMASRSYANDLDALADISDESHAALERLAALTSEDWDHRPIQAYRNDLKVLRDELEETIERINELQSGPALERADRTAPMGGGTHERELNALGERRAALESQIEIEQELIRLREHQAGLAEHDDIANTLDLLSQAGSATVNVLERLGLVSRNAAGGLGEMAAARGEIVDPIDEQIAALEREAAVLRMVAEESRSAAEAQLEYQYQLDLAAAREADAADATNANVAAVKEKYARLRELTGQVADYQQAADEAATADQKHAQQMQKAAQAFGQLLGAIDPTAAKQRELNEQLQMMRQLLGDSDALARFGINAGQVRQIIAELDQQLESLGGTSFGFDFDFVLDNFDEVKTKIEEIAEIEFGFENLIDSFHPLAQEMRRLGDEIAFIDEALNEGVIGNAQAGFAKTGVVANAAFNAIKSGLDESSSAFQAVALAQQALNTILGIGAVLQTAATAPWPANFVAMAQMAAMVASLGVEIGNVTGGGGADVAQRRQDTQGTGTVLGDSGAASESILNASEITADATSELVGINRGMLRALTGLQEGIGNAAVMVARGALNNIDLPSLNLGSSDFGFTSKKLVDEGIALMAGAIRDMTEGAVAQAFTETRESNLFSTTYRQRFSDLDDAFNDQINLIFASMIDTVESAGEALGIPLDQIERQITQFEVAAQEISLKDLDAEERQAELEAVFSRIFDNLANAAIPFIDQFQEIGEGMGEVLVRVATSVQVVEESITRLGLAIDQTNPERLAQISVGLIEAVGGIEEFVGGMESFVAKFAPESHQVAIATDDLTRALEQVGLAVPGTREEMWALIGTLDASTEAGRDQIAMLLELTDAADTYYSSLEEVQKERLGLERQILELQGATAALRQIELEELDESNRALQERIWALQDEQEIADVMSRAREEIAQLSLDPLVNEFRQLMVAHDNLIERARALGMSEQQLGVLRFRHQLQLDQLTASIEESIRSIWEQLQGTNQGASGSFGSSFTGAIDNAASQIRDSIIRALESVQDWLNRSDFEDPSLTPRARLAQMQEEFDRLIDVARTGSGQEQADAIAALPQLASQLRQLGVQVHGSATEPFQDFRNGIVEAMQSVLGIDVPDAQDPVTGSQVGAIGSSVDSVSQSQAQQTALAAQLLEQLGVLVEISGNQAPDIAERLGVNLGSVIGDLIGEVEQGSIETVEQLVAVANTLGMELTGVAEAIGLHVGALADQESMFSEALENAILRMPPEIQGKLWGPLERIWAATNETDANDAIDNLIDATRGLPAEYTNLLAPFFDEIETRDLHLEEIGLLDQIRGILGDSAFTLAQIEAAIRGTAPPSEAGINDLPAGWIEPDPTDSNGPPQYSAAGGWANGLVMTGDGSGPELILPAEVSTFFQRQGIPLRGGETDPRVAQYLARLVELEEQAYRQRDELGREQRQATIQIATSMDDAAREARSLAGMAR